LKTIFIWLILTPLSISEPSIRIDFHNQKITQSYLDALQSVAQWNENPIIEAYVGISETMLAEEAFWPIEKWNHGQAKIEQAIDKDQANPELRYLRLLVQLNAPSFLSYDENIESDLDFYISNILNSGLNMMWIKKFCYNLLNGKRLSDLQRGRLNAFLLDIND
jgi:hypothetical protein